MTGQGLGIFYDIVSNLGSNVLLGRSWQGKQHVDLKAEC